MAFTTASVKRKEKKKKKKTHETLYLLDFINEASDNKMADV